MIEELFLVKYKQAKEKHLKSDNEIYNDNLFKEVNEYGLEECFSETIDYMFYLTHSTLVYTMNENYEMADKVRFIKEIMESELMRVLIEFEEFDLMEDLNLAIEECKKEYKKLNRFF